MNVAKKNIPEQNPESYSPERKPEILNLAEYMEKATIVDEILIKDIDNY